MRTLISALFSVMLILPQAAHAEGFSRVNQRDHFVSLIEGRNLTRMGIKLRVTKDGQIVGRAFGRDVKGAWQWRSGYFCRDLYWGKQDLGPNCQAVKVQGKTVRFISDQGTGQFADLVLK